MNPRLITFAKVFAACFWLGVTVLVARSLTEPLAC